MGELKLPKLPERTPVKLTINIPPDLHIALGDYAEIYEATYSQREAVADLIPFMLAAFLEGDRGFMRRRHQKTAAK